MKTYLLRSAHGVPLLGITLTFLFLVLSPYQVFAQSVKEEWARRHSSTVQSNENSVHLAIDDAGNAYVTGNSVSPTLGNHIVTVKYSPAGDELWVSRYSAFLSASVRDITVDNKGDIYITGSNTSSSARAQLLVLKYNGEDGTQVWVKDVGPPQVSGGNRIVVDNLGGVYVSGSSSSNFSPTNTIFIRKYSAATGDYLWAKSFDTSSTTAEVRRFITYGVDSAGDFYLVGENLTNALTIKYRGTDGEKLWSYIFDEPLYAIRSGLTLHDGVVYITGTAQSTGTYLAKHSSADGKQVWLQQNIKSADGSPFTALQNLVADDAGGLYGVATINAGKYVARFSATDGKLAWATRSAADIVALYSDETGSVYARSTNAEENHLLTKYNAATGNQLWQYSFSAITTNVSSSPDVQVNKGNVYVAGLKTFTGEAVNRIFVARIDAATGKEQWERKFVGTVPTAESPVAMVTDEEGNVYVTGMTVFNRRINPPGSMNEAITVKYSSSGELMWAKHYPLGSIQNVSVRDIKTDNEGGIYVLGTRFSQVSNGDFLVLKYAASDGALLWETTYDRNNSNEREPVMAIDDAGGVYISGSSNNGNSVTVTIKFDAATGKQVWLAQHPTSAMFPGTPEISPKGIVVHDGQVYVAGNTFILPGEGASKDQDFGLLKYSATNGAFGYYSYYDAGGGEVVVDMEFHPEHGIFLLAHQNEKPVFARFEHQTGNLMWFKGIEHIRDAGEMDMAVDDEGGIYVTGGSPFGCTMIMKFDKNANGKWGTSGSCSEYGSGLYDTGLAIEVDNRRGVYVLGARAHLSQESRFTLFKHDAESSSQLWAVTSDRGNSEFPVALTLDKDLNMYVTGGGHTGIGYSPGADIVTIKYSQGIPCDMPVTVTLSLPPHAIAVGEQLRTTADFGDYILGDDHGIRWEWGDNLFSSSVAYKDPEATHITGQHRYAEAGIYKVGLNFNKSCLVEANYDYEEWAVVYDPSGGVVTGEGELYSRFGPLSLMNFEQMVPYSFNISYEEDAGSVPQGFMEFGLENHGTFSSSSFTWLVIQGKKAAWHGEGTLNGRGRYGFIVSVQDGQLPGNTGMNDQFRIRIWDLEDNRVLYDNYSQDGDIYDMASSGQYISGGYIFVNNSATIASQTTAQKAELYNYPNTFTDKTTISFTLPKTGDYTLEVYDMRGKLVQQLATGKAKAGQNYSYELSGAALPKGMYVARLVSSSGTQTIKMLLQR